MTPKARVGLIDMGSNAIRTEIIELDDRGGWESLERDRAAVRLGGDVFADGEIGAATMQRALEALRAFKATCDRLAVGRIEAIATSATREARNGHDFLARIHAETGVLVQAITGLTEAHYLRCAIDTKLDTSQGTFLLVDVGGGSVEVVRLRDGELLDAESYPLGTVRLLQAIEQYATCVDDELLEHLTIAMRPSLNLVRERFEGSFDQFVATGGNIESIADLIHTERSPDRELGVVTLHRKEISALTRRVAALDHSARMQEFDIRSDRADTIVPAGLVYNAIARLASATKILVPRVGVRAGLRAATVLGLDPPAPPLPPGKQAP